MARLPQQTVGTTTPESSYSGIEPPPRADIQGTALTRIARKRLPLDAARLVDERERLAEAGERVGVDRRGAARRSALHHRLLAFRHRRDDRLIGRSIARPGGVLV